MNEKGKCEYQIIGEVAKNLLNQSIDKLKQIKKLVDILLIDKNLEINDLNDAINNLVKEYLNLKLDIKAKKLIFLLTNGSFFELKNY